VLALQKIIVSDVEVLRYFARLKPNEGFADIREKIATDFLTLFRAQGL
jgi:hypothetical protein